MPPNPPWLLGLDLGSGSIRALLLRADGSGHVAAARPWSFPASPLAPQLGFDLDLEEAFARVAEAVREVLARSGAEPAQVAGVAVSAHRFGTVVLAADGEPLLAVPNRDSRATAQWLRLLGEHAERLHAASGLWPLSIHTSARLRWLAEEQPERFARARAVVAVNDWLAFRLCGELATDASQASCSGLFSLADGAWAAEAVGALGLPTAILPEVRPAGSRLGGLGAGAAAALGLAPGTPVAVGGADTQCGLLGAGVLAPGAAGIVAGTTAPVQLVVERPRIDPSARLWAGCHVAPGRFVVESNGGPVGEVLDWLAGWLFPDAREPVRRLLAESARSEPGAAGLLSTLGADQLDPRSPGMPVGQLTLSHLTTGGDRDARRHVARAVLEGIACGLRRHVEQVEALAERPAAPLRFCGGLARSGHCAEVLAGILGRPIEVAAVPEATALGAALCAAVGAGLHPDLDAAAAAGVRIARRVEPREAERDAYAALFAGWSELREAGEPGRSVARRLVTPWALRARASGPGRGAAAARPRALVTASFDDASLARLRELADVAYAPFREARRLLTGAALVEALGDAAIFVTEIDVLDADALAKLPALRAVAACRGDAVNVDVEACTAYGIPVLFAPGRNADAVADLTVAFLLALARKLPDAAAFLRDPSVTPGNLGKMGQAFVQLQGRELFGKTVGLVGLGAVGRGVARRLAGFGIARLLVADPFVSDDDVARLDGRKVELDALLAECDAVSLHAPVTDQTRGLLDAARLGRMKRGAWLVNTARAALVDEAALFAALESGGLAGAAIDTFSVEPPGAEHPLVQHPRVISTPHVGGNTVEVAAHQGALIAEGLARLLRGERPPHVRNPQVLEGFSLDGPRREPTAAELARLREAAGPAVTDLQRDAKRRDGAGRSD